jgi:hypothetical protein
MLYDGPGADEAVADEDFVPEAPPVVATAMTAIAATRSAPPPAMSRERFTVIPFNA